MSADGGRANRESERRFLVGDREILIGLHGDEILQGYMWKAAGWALRARRTYQTSETGSETEISSFITAKGRRDGFNRPEYEIPVEAAHAAELIRASPFHIHKTRYPKIFDNEMWEFDVFHGRNAGLVLAEIEASPATLARIKKPYWAVKEVTTDERYHNENLAEHPWPEWYRDSE